MILITDIVNIKKLSIIIIYLDATTYYYSVTYPFASLSTQNFYLESTYLAILFKAIQIIKMFLRTSFSIFEVFYIKKKDRSFQRLIQGKGGALAL